MKVYFISGLAADARVFKHIELPESYEAVHINWIPPLAGESLHGYASRLYEKIDGREPFVLAGLSLGGMIASEMAEIHAPEKLILISSIGSSSELPPYFRFAARIRLHKLMPVSFFKSASLIKRFFTTETSADKIYLRQAIRESDPAFIRWAIDAILNWKKNTAPECVRIHGSEDLLLPVRYTRATHIIKGAGHMMVLNRAVDINAILREVLLPLKHTQ